MKTTIITGFILVMALAQPVVADPLIEFHNGDKTNADDVNKNFNELANRISAIHGALPATYDSANYSVTASQKVFAITDSNPSASVVKEIQNFDRATIPGKTLMYLQRLNSNDALIGLNVQTYTSDGRGNLWEKNQAIGAGPDPAQPFVADTVLWTETFEPAIVQFAKSMVVGQSWGSGAIVSHEDPVNGNTTMGFTEVRTLLGVEDVSVPAGNYTACLKVSVQHATFQNISWVCPGGVGVAKRIESSLDSNTLKQGTRIFELQSITMP